VLALLLSQAAQACPDPEHDGQPITAGPDGARQEFTVVAGGEHNGARCDITPEDHPGVLGFFTEAPTLTLDLDVDELAPLDLRVEAPCDVVLLVHAGSERWFFDDDAGDGDLPVVTIPAAAAGRYDIWVGGFFEPTTCDAIVILQGASD
jgi:hypothetical protein